MTKRLIILAFAALFTVAACGKKAPLRTPSSDRPPAEEPAETPSEDDASENEY